MGNVMIINASPRAPRSNSKQYADLFARYYGSQTEYAGVTKNNHLMLCRSLEHFSDVLFVFPLYADSVPVTLLDFLKNLEANPPQKRPTISVMINCGFLEPQQNDVAVEMLRFYCRKNGYPFGSVLKIGSGEAILTTPFRILLKLKMKSFAASVKSRKYLDFQVTMPISKKMFVKASTRYWENYGKKFGVSKDAMATMQIES